LPTREGENEQIERKKERRNATKKNMREIVPAEFTAFVIYV